MPDKFTYDYGTPSKVLAMVDLLQQAERIRACNRALVNRLFNGERPWSEEQIKNLQIQVAVNWGEGQNMITRANTQINGALLHKGNFFNSKCLKGPIEKREEWGQKFTEFIQEPMKRGDSGKRHLFLMRNRNASLTLHGIGPMLWDNDNDWMPRYVALEDLLIPTDTLLDFSNLTQFAVNLYPTPYQLFDMTHGEKKHEGWNMKQVHRILATYKSINVNPYNYDWYDQPEKMAEIWKQNRVPCDNDSVPVVRLVAFYYRDTTSTDDDQKWYRRVVMKQITASADNDAMAPDPDEFLFKWDRPFSTNINHILHVQYGDCSIVPPLKHQSVRGLGTSLYSVIECMNRLRCQFTQHVFESLLMYFRVTNPAMQDRPKQMRLIPFGVIPEGFSLIPRAERHQIDASLIDRLMGEYRQLMSENSASFVQDISKGEQGNPITATEANIRLQGVNVIVSSMLNMLYEQENFYYEEIVRRFLNKTSSNKDVLRFQERCKKVGIPESIMDPECWQIDAERVFGGGDQMLAEQEVTKLQGIRAQLDPSAQRIIDRQYVTVITRDHAKGRLLVPDNPAQATDGLRAGEIAFGGLMADALPRSLPEGIEREDYIEAMLQMAEAKMGAIAQADNVGNPQEIMGLQAVLQHIEQNVQVLAQDVKKRELVKQFTDTLSQLQNALKGFAQRLQEQMANEQPGDPEAEAKAQVTVQQAALKARINSNNATQRLQENQAKFEQQMRESIQKSNLEISQSMEKHRMEMLTQFTETKAALLSDRAQTMADIENKRKMAAATPEPKSN